MEKPATVETLRQLLQEREEVGKRLRAASASCNQRGLSESERERVNEEYCDVGAEHDTLEIIYEDIVPKLLPSMLTALTAPPVENLPTSVPQCPCCDKPLECTDDKEIWLCKTCNGDWYFKASPPPEPAEPAGREDEELTQKELQSWCIRNGKGNILVRNNGDVIYDGLEADMPADVKAIADEMTTPPTPASQPPAERKETELLPRSGCHNADVYYNAEADNYYCSVCNSGQGLDFYSIVNNKGGTLGKSAVRLLRKLQDDINELELKHQSAITAATVELQAERDAAIAEIQAADEMEKRLLSLTKENERLQKKITDQANSLRHAADELAALKAANR